MSEFLKHLFTNQSQFTSSGLLLMLVGGISVFLRELPVKIWEAIVRQTTLSISIKDEDAAFQWVKEWFLEQNFLKRVRRVDLDTTLRGAETALVPAAGTHLFWYRGRPFWVSLHRSDEVKARSQRRSETLTFMTVGREQRFLRAFVAEVAACHHRKVEKASWLYVYDDYWTKVEAYSPRLLESVILPPGEKELLVEDLTRFRGSRERYRRLGIPYHRGYLLYGPPGTGKTSFVSALAGAFGMSIYLVNLTEFNDRTLKSAMNDVPENSVILFEDIDCMKAGNRRPKGAAAPMSTAADKQISSVVTLSGLLNVLDGFHAPENVIFVMTTNHMEALDPALLRPGRIDFRLFMGPAAESQKAELYSRFFPEATASKAASFARVHEAETMAEFQGRLLQLELGIGSVDTALADLVSQ